MPVSVSSGVVIALMCVVEAFEVPVEASLDECVVSVVTDVDLCAVCVVGECDVGWVRVLGPWCGVYERIVGV